jgi:hypothetical protein
MASIAAAGVFALASVSVINDAQAQRCRGCGIGLGILGGLAAGAIIGGAVAPPPYRPPSVPYAPNPGSGYAAPSATFAPSRPASSALNCGAANVVGNDDDPNVIVSTYVAHDPGKWMIKHALANGTVVDRSLQYAITDYAGPSAQQWRGTLNRNPNMTMVGEVMRLKSTGQPTYNEWLYNDGQMVMHSMALCQIDRPISTAAASGPVMPPVATPVTPHGEDSVGIINLNNAVFIQLSVGARLVLMQIDTGATEMTISNSVARALIANGEAILTTDKTYVLANGAKVTAKRVIIHDVRIGAHVLRDVAAGIVPDDAGMLLPFPVLNQVGRFTIDTNNSKLIFG